MEWISKLLIKVEAKVAYHGRRWQIHLISAFLQAQRYKVVSGLVAVLINTLTGPQWVSYA